GCGTCLLAARALILEEQPTSEERSEPCCQREHRRAGTLVAHEPVDGRDHADEHGDTDEDLPLDAKITVHTCGSCIASGYLASHTGRFERIGGSGSSKLCGDGGDVVAHSNVCPSHGSLPATGPCFHDRQTFHKNGNVDAPSRNAPMEEMRFNN